MADLEIKFTGSSQELLKELKAVTGELNKVEKATRDAGKGGQEATGYIGGLQNQMKLMRAQMKSASQDELPSLRTQFLQLRQSLKEAQYGTESFTSKIGGQFENALNKTTKKLFDFKNVLKLTAGAVGLGAITAQLLKSTGAADALAGAIDNVVESIKNVGKAQIQVDLAKGVDVLKVGQQFLDSQLPANVAIIKTMTDEIDKLTARLSRSNAARAIRASGGVPQGSGFLRSEGGVATFNPADIMSDEKEAATRNRLALLQEYVSLIQQVGYESSAASFGVGQVDGAFDRLEGKLAITVDLLDSLEKSANEQFELYKRSQQFIPASPGRTYQDDPQTLLNSFNTASAEEFARRTGNIQSLYDIQIKNAIALGDVDLAVKLHNEKEAFILRNRLLDKSSDILAAGTYAALHGSFDNFFATLRAQLEQGAIRGIFKALFAAGTGGQFGIADFFGSLLGLAGGGEFYTRGPQMIMVGDNPGGVERVTVEPISGRGQTRMLGGGTLAMAGGGSIEPIRGGLIGGATENFNVTIRGGSGAGQIIAEMLSRGGFQLQGERVLT